MRTKRNFYFLMVVLLLFGCAGADLKNTETKGQIAPVLSNGMFNKAPTDKDLYLSALARLSVQGKEPNYTEARSMLNVLIEEHPGSKWVESAQAIIGLIDSLTAMQADMRVRTKKAQADQARQTRDIEGLKEQIKAAEAGNLAEIERLQQENEKLNDNLQQLKKLEVQLEKREKMLR
ncbi:MAG: hypothetical protein R6W75_07265 [Smithellaceae bacterium]